MTLALQRRCLIREQPSCRYVLIEVHRDISNAPHQLIYGLVARQSTILAEHTTSQGNFTQGVSQG